MIIVASNWAIGDGTLVAAAPPPLATAATAMHRAAIRAGVREDGRYRPIDRLDIVLAGDTFDWLTSAEWLGDAKPWQASTRSAEILATIARRSMRQGRAVLGPLVRWARRGLPVPVTMRDREGPRWTATVPVRVTLLGGDRDSGVEEIVRGRGPFTVGRWWDDGRVSVRHGHESDPACRIASRTGVGIATRPPTLAESVGVELVARFAAMLADAPVRSRFPIRRVAEAGVTGIPAAIAAWRTVAGAGRTEADGIAESWRRCVDSWWRQARRCVPSCEVEFDVIDALAAWLSAAVREGAEACPLAAGFAALVPAAARGGTGSVFGHLRGTDAHGAAVGLATPGTGAATGTMVACCGERGLPRWRALAAGHDQEAIVAIRSSPPRLIVPQGTRVVDAA